MAEDKNQQPQQDSNISLNPMEANIGMNLDSISRQLRPGQLSYALNAQVENFDGNSVTYQNEQGNVLCTNFPIGFKVIGILNIIEDNLIIVWLLNPITKDCQIGTITNCIYTKSIDDPCLGFNINNPIQKAVHKKTNCGLEIYWVEKDTPMRYINLDKLPFKEIIGVNTCQNEQTTMVDCNKLSIMPNFSIPQLSVIEIDNDGENIAGTYRFAACYANIKGEAYTSYYSLTNKVSLYDPNKITQDFNYLVSKSIILEIDNIDNTGYYDYINIAVLKTINNIDSVELVGTFQITGESRKVTYTGQSKTDIRLTLDDLTQKYPTYTSATDLTTVGDILIFDGMSLQERISYQEIASSITLQWQTWRLIGKNTYQNPFNTSNRRGYMRDEVYPYELCFLLDNGYQTDGFTIPSRALRENDLEPISNNDVIPLQDSTICNPTVSSEPAWKVYNTASVTSYEQEYLDNQGNACYEGPYQFGEFAGWESTDTYPCNDYIYGSLSGQPIRHHKFPDVSICPIHDSHGYIYPIGVKIDVQQVVNAINNSSLTEEQKNKIVGFKILRGNRANNKSVVAKGLLTNVGKYDKNSTSYYFPNYLYNDLGKDPFLSDIQTGTRTGSNPDFQLDAFSSPDSKLRFAFHSPDTSFFQPTLGNVLKLETIESGLSQGHFVQVQNHSRYKFLSLGSYLASLAIGMLIGFASATYGVSDQPFDGAAAFTAYQTLTDIIDRIAPYVNETYQYDSIGNYTDSIPVHNNGNKQRSLDIAAYLLPGVFGVGDQYAVNNFQRESSVYLRSTVSLPFPNEQGGPLDTSKVVACTSDLITEPISSYYCSIKNIFENQYGQIYSYDTIDTGYQRFISLKAKYGTETIFGGDTFINQFAYKSKIPFFIDNRVSPSNTVALNNSDIAYDTLGNVAFPTYWFSTSITKGDGGAFNVGSLFGEKVNNFNCSDGGFFYDSGKIYLFAYGVPYFYCESEVNVDMRQAYNSLEGDYFPHVSSFIPDNWFQEQYVTINYDNTYNYNKTYSGQNDDEVFTHLPNDFSNQECLSKLPFRAIYSEPQSDYTYYRRNNWLIYKPISYFDFPQNYGNLVSLDGLENKQVIARFENKSLIYNALLTAPTSAANVYLGQTLFSKDVPPLDYAETDIGYVGTQHKFFLKTEFGNITIDSKRGQVFLLPRVSYYQRPTAVEISNEQVNKFLTQYLDFDIIKTFPGVNIDNSYNGCGLHGVYDSKYNRFILTKLDYSPLPGTNLTFNPTTQKFFFEDIEVELGDPTFFCNRSFTLSYDFDNKAWISFHSYLPNFYLSDANFFYSGINTVASLWKHNIEFATYNSFYGEIAPYIIEYSKPFQYEDEILQNIQDYTKVYQYLDEQTFIETNDFYFNKMIISNGQQSSGILGLVPKPKNNLQQYQKYPIYNTDSKTVLVTKSNNFYQVNTFWNVIKDPQQPIWKSSCQSLSLYKELNQPNCDYGKRSFHKQPLMAKDVKVRLINDDKTNVKLISQFIVAPSQKSYK